MAARKEWTAAVCSRLRSSWRLRPPATLVHSKGAPGNRGAALHRLLAMLREVRSRRARSASARSVRARRPLDSGGRTTSLRASRGMTTWEARWGETPSIPARSFKLIQGQSDTRSMARFSAGRSVAGSRQSGTPQPGPATARSAGTEARCGSGSSGSSPPGARRSRAWRRPTALLTAWGLHTGSSGVAWTASLSTARNTGAGKPSSIRRVCRSRTGSGMRTRTAPGERPAAQLPHPVGEGGPVGGVPPPDDADGAAVGKLHGGVQGRGPVPAEPDGIRDAGENGGQPVHGSQGVQALHEDAPPAVGDGAEADQLVYTQPLLGGQPLQPGGGEVEPLGGGKEAGGVGHGVAEAARVQPVHGLVHRAPGPARYRRQVQPVHEGHRRQGAQNLGLAAGGPHGFTPAPLSSLLSWSRSASNRR